MTEEPTIAVAEAWTGRVLPIEKGNAVATAERRAVTPKEESGGARVSIPLRDIVQIITALLAVAAIVWTLRSDIRDLKTTMQLQDKLQEERWTNQAKSMTDLKAKQEMQGLKYDELKDKIGDLEVSLAGAGFYQPKKPITITNRRDSP